MPPDEFVGRLRDWLAGGVWPEMDSYGEYVGAEGEALASPSLLVSWGVELVTWLWGDEAALKGALGIG